MSILRPHLGEVFREDFRSNLDVVKRGGVITGGTINNGYTASGTNRVNFESCVCLRDMSAFTCLIRAKLNTDSSSNFGGLFSIDAGAGANLFLNIAYDGTKANLKFFVSNGSSTISASIPTSSTTNDVEYEYAAVYNGATISLYLNGAFVTSSAAVFGTIPFSTATEIVAGTTPAIGGSAIAGTYKDIVLIDRAYTAKEVADSYKNATFSYENNLVACWLLNDKIGTDPYTTSDFSAGNAAMTLGDGLISTKYPTKIAGRNGYTLDGGDYFLTTSISSKIPAGGSERSVVVWSKRTNDAGGVLLTINADTGQDFIIDDIVVLGVNYVFSDGINTANNISVTDAQRAKKDEIACHILTLDGSDGYSYYVNDSLIKSGTFTVPINTNTISSMIIGNSAALASGFVGDIYSVKVYDRCLTATHAKDIFSKGSHYLGNR